MLRLFFKYWLLKQIPSSWTNQTRKLKLDWLVSTIMITIKIFSFKLRFPGSSVFSLAVARTEPGVFIQIHYKWSTIFFFTRLIFHCNKYIYIYTYRKVYEIILFLFFFFFKRNSMNKDCWRKRNKLNISKTFILLLFLFPEN